MTQVVIKRMNAACVWWWGGSHRNVWGCIAVEDSGICCQTSYLNSFSEKQPKIQNLIHPMKNHNLIKIRFITSSNLLWYKRKHFVAVCICLFSYFRIFFRALWLFFWRWLSSFLFSTIYIIGEVKLFFAQFGNWYCPNVHLVCFWNPFVTNYSKFVVEFDWNNKISENLRILAFFEKMNVFFKKSEYSWNNQKV